MINFIYCPICNDALLNNRFGVLDCNIYCKYCDRRLGHKFSITYNINTNEVLSASLIIPDHDKGDYFKDYYINWDCKQKSLLVIGNETQEIPYFEPDFYNFKNLLEKIKTYVLFS